MTWSFASPIVARNGACHPGGHYWDCYTGALSSRSLQLNWRCSTCRFHWICSDLTWSDGTQIIFPAQVVRWLAFLIKNCTLRWRHNGRDSVSNRQPHDCLLNRFSQTQVKENINALRHWPLCGEFTGDRWIPRTNGQSRGKCFHLMTSSWRKYSWWHE